MKKFISVILSVMIILSSFAMSQSAFAATKADVPTVKIGTTLDLDIAPLSLDTIKSITDDDVLDFDDIEKAQAEAEKKMAELDIWYAKITPEETGYYEFVFDKKFNCKGMAFKDLLSVYGDAYDELLEDDGLLNGTIALFAAGLSDAKGNEKGTGLSINVDFGDSEDDDDVDFIKSIFELLSISKNPSFTAKLKKGKTYYLSMYNISAKNYKTKLRISKHQHTLKDVNEKATYKYDKDLEMNWGDDGFVGKRCTCKYCDYEKGKTYPAVAFIEVKDVVYTGERLTPDVDIYLDNGKKLKKKFYTVKYSNNKNYGSGKAVVKFRGNYKGKSVERFNIVPKAVGIKEVKAKKKTATVKWKKSKEKISGYQIEYSTDKFFFTSKKVNVKGAKNTEKTFKKLKKSGKKYFFRIRTYRVVNGDKYFSQWSKTKSAGAKTK